MVAFDLLIAAIAGCHKAKIVTRNRADFEACGAAVNDPGMSSRIGSSPAHPFSLKSLRFSRSQSRVFSASRLSCSFLPRASAISIFARPFSLK